MRPSNLPFTFAVLVVFACIPSKDNESTDTLEETQGPSSSHSGSSTSVGTAGPPTPPDPTTTLTTGGVTGDPAPATSTTTTTTDPPVVTTTATSGDDECMLEQPGLESCDNSFIVTPDLGGGIQCDIFIQTCPQGQKCNSWSSDGDGSWDATKCVPIDPEPDPIGAPCTVKGNGVSGFDSCVNVAMCWNVDENTGIGTCVEQCKCEPDNPICLTPNTTCVITNDGVLPLCLPVCDPLDPGSCAGGEVCVANPVKGRPFVCVADGSEAPKQVGDPCEAVNACGPALLCGDPALLPGLCDDQFIGCCIPYCDLSASDCPPGASCLPWHEPGEAPKCFENIGACGVEP